MSRNYGRGRGRGRGSYRGGFNNYYEKNFKNYGYNGRSSEGMTFGGDTNITNALVNLGIQAQKMLDRQIDYRSPPRTNPYYRGWKKKKFSRPWVRNESSAIEKQKMLYRCILCKQVTHNKKGHLEHMKTKRHLDTVLDRESFMGEKLRKIVVKMQNEAEELEKKYPRTELNFCHVCCVNFEGSVDRHNGAGLHKKYLYMTEIECTECRLVFNNRYRYEKHLLTVDHIRNRHYNMLKKEDYVVSDEVLGSLSDQPNQVTGYEFVGDVRGYYCQVCEELFLHQKVSMLEHSQTEKHYEKFKEYAKKKIAEIETAQKKEDQGAVKTSPTKGKKVVQKKSKQKTDMSASKPKENAETMEKVEEGDDETSNTEPIEKVEETDDQTSEAEPMEQVEERDGEISDANEVADEDEKDESMEDEEVGKEDEEADSIMVDIGGEEDVDIDKAEGVPSEDEHDETLNGANGEEDELNFEDAETEHNSPEEAKPSTKADSSSVIPTRRSSRNK